MYKIVLTSWGGTCVDYCTGLTYEEACDMYNSMEGIYDDGGYLWDLEIEEE